MKRICIMFSLFFAIAFLHPKCRKKYSQKDSQCEQCGNQVLLQKFTNVAGTIKKVSGGEYFYNGGKYYVLVNAKSDLPSLYSINKQEFEKIFPCSPNKYKDTDTGRVVTISGHLFSCLTANHGRPTNNLYTFAIFE